MRNRPPCRRRPSGFSLIEFTAVLALMALLAGIVSVSVHHLLVKGKQDAAKAQIASLRDGVETFYTDVGRYPTNDEGLDVLTKTSAKVQTPIMRQVPLDPWDHPYQYLCPGPTQPFEIKTLGADGREGGSGADADISSEDLRATPGK
jgi:general secretion pathway protein G